MDWEIGRVDSIVATAYCTMLRRDTTLAGCDAWRSMDGTREPAKRFAKCRPAGGRPRQRKVKERESDSPSATEKTQTEESTWTWEYRNRIKDTKREQSTTWCGGKHVDSAMSSCVVVYFRQGNALLLCCCCSLFSSRPRRLRIINFVTCTNSEWSSTYFNLSRPISTDLQPIVIMSNTRYHTA